MGPHEQMNIEDDFIVLRLQNDSDGNAHHEIRIGDDFRVVRFQNDSDETSHYEREVGTDLIQFHFGIKGRAKFTFNQGRYALDPREEVSLFLYNPQKELPVHLEVAPHS